MVATVRSTVDEEENYIKMEKKRDLDWGSWNVQRGSIVIGKDSKVRMFLVHVHVCLFSPGVMFPNFKYS